MTEESKAKKAEKQVENLELNKETLQDLTELEAEGAQGGVLPPELGIKPTTLDYGRCTTRSLPAGATAGHALPRAPPPSPAPRTPAPRAGPDTVISSTGWTRAPTTRTGVRRRVASGVAAARSSAVDGSGPPRMWVFQRH